MSSTGDDAPEVPLPARDAADIGAPDHRPPGGCSAGGRCYNPTPDFTDISHGGLDFAQGVESAAMLHAYGNL